MDNKERAGVASAISSNVLVKDVLRNLGLNRTLDERIHVTRNGQIDTSKKSFVLYLPTVVLRKKHNPGFALSCRLANYWKIPLIVLCVVLDDAHFPFTGATNNDRTRFVVVSTSRRLTFQLQALQQCAREWQESGASVWIRVHDGDSKSRTPHHLSLAQRATITVTDEPFVHPYRQLVNLVERATSACIRVDGSTIVPPLSILRKASPQSSSTNQQDDNITSDRFVGVPDKAWKWNEMTKSKQTVHVHGVVEGGHFDSPQLQCSAPPSHELLQSADATSLHGALSSLLPKQWMDPSVSAPDKRPWTVQELLHIVPEEFSTTRPGIDATVPPCHQTHGAEGWSRWQQFKQQSLKQYANRRNDITQPFAVSRLSCFLNIGTISIFQIIYELWQFVPKSPTKKFLDEIVKWREIAYAHAFASSDDYFAPTAVPSWAREYLASQRLAAAASSSSPMYTLEQLVNSNTQDATWNAMQDYLRTTGELHNNARMTWGKTVVHWQKKGLTLHELLLQMVILNDRFALDGLSPPSYAGLLWCLGWCDKPAGRRISEKPAHRYRRAGPEDFRDAQQMLLNKSRSGKRQLTLLETMASAPSKQPKL